MKYRADIDGLRALAIIPVILFHMDIPGFHGGFIGVDIFFVISGFLITSIIVKDLRDQKFSFVNFYQRRARRLFPAALLVMVFCCVAGWILFAPEDYMSFGKSLWTFALFSSNIQFMREVGYFDLPATLKPLLHTWSLSVEEQFYLFFPILLLALYTYCRGFLVRIIVLIAILSFVLSIYTVQKYPAFAFYMLPSRAWELMLGALLALGIIPEIKNKLLVQITSFIGFILIAVSLVFLDQSVPFPGLAALLPCLGCFFIIWSGSHNEAFPNKLLHWKPLVFIGLISYPLYLWHWPLIVFSKYSLERDLFPGETILLLLAIFSLSILTWKVFELPLRQKLVFENDKYFFASVCSAGIAFVIFGQITVQTRGLPHRLPEPARSYAMGALDKNHDARKCESITNGLPSCQLGISPTGNAPPDFIVWGDSHARMLLPIFQKLANDKKLFGLMGTHSACPSIIHEFELDKECINFNDVMLGAIKEKKIKNIIIAGYWKLHLKMNPDSFKLAFSKTLASLKDYKVWVFMDVPDQDRNIPSALSKAAMNGRDLVSIGRLNEQHKHYQNILKEIIIGVGGDNIKIISADDILCGKLKHCLIFADGKSLYRDNNHLTKFGADFISKSFEPAFEAIRKDRSSLPPDDIAYSK